MHKTGFNMVGKLYIVSASSGAGKTSLINAVLSQLDKTSIHRAVSFTSRSPRLHEQDGIDYHFISAKEFQEKIQQSFFIEWSNVYGNYYGLPVSLIERVKKGESYVAILDVSGAQALKKLYPQACTIWIEPPSLKILEQRLVNRGDTDMDTIHKRLILAKKEMENEKEKRFFAYHVINDDFDAAVSELNNIFKNCQ